MTTNAIAAQLAGSCLLSVEAVARLHAFLGDYLASYAGAKGGEVQP